MLPASAHCSRPSTQVSIIGPYRRRRARATRPAAGASSSRQPTSAGDEERVAPGRSCPTLMRRAYRRPVTDADLEGPLEFYRQARADGRFRRGHRDGAGARPGESAVPVPRRAGSAPAVAPNTPYRISDLELASRLSFFLWSSIPDDELLDWRRSRRAAASPPCSSSRCGGCWPTTARERSSTNFAGAVAAPAQPRLDHAGHAPVPGLRRQPAAGVPAGDRAVLRQHPARGPQRARPAEGRLHVPQRAAREALRHSARLRQPLPPRRAGRRQHARRTAAPGQHPDGHVVRDAHLAGDSRQVGAREPARRRRRRRRRPTCRRSKDNTVDGTPVGARAAGRASQQRGLRELPPADGSGRLLARELRRRRPLAHDRGRRSRSMPPAACPTAASSPASPASKQALLDAPGAVRRDARPRSC